MKREKIVEIGWFVFIVAIFVFAMVLVRGGQLQEKVESFGILAPLVIILLKMSTLIIAPLGGSPLYLVAGALYGSTKAFIIVMIGDILGSITCFVLARKYGAKIVRKLAGEKYFEKIEKALSVLNDTKSFIKARIGFMTIPELVAYSAGLSKMNFFTFVVLNSLFFIPLNLLYVYLGSKLVDLSLKYFFILPLITFVLALGGLSLLYKDYEKQNDTNTQMGANDTNK